MSFKKIFMFTGLMFLVTSVMADASEKTIEKRCPGLFFHGHPVHATASVNENSYFICNKAYATQYFTGTKTPLWVAERLLEEATSGSEPRTEDFQKDPEVSARHSSSNGDFVALNKRLKARHSGLEKSEKYVYDRGHMAPAGDFSNDSRAMSESFYLSNMVPQVSSHNRGIWKDLEVKTRNWAKGRNEVYVVTGPIFRSKAGYKEMRGIEEMNGLLVPTDIYKIIVDPKTAGSIAFIIPNIPFQSDGGRKESKGYVYNGTIYQLKDFIVSIRDVEVLTGLNFHSNLNAKDSDVVEIRKSGMWTR